MGKYFGIFLKWLVRIALAVIVFVILLVLIIQLPGVQTYISSRLIGSISSQTGTVMSVERVDIRIPKTIRVKGLYAEDLQGDTLVYAGELAVDIHLFSLLRNKVHINELHLTDAVVNMHRLPPDTAFNYQFLPAAFQSNDENGHTSGAGQGSGSMQADRGQENIPWQFDVHHILLNNVRFRYADHFAGLDLLFRTGRLETRVDRLNLSDMQYHLGYTFFQDVDVSLKASAAFVEQKPAGEPDGKLPDVGISQLILEELSFSYQDQHGFALTTGFDKLDIRSRQIDLEAMAFDLNRFLLSGLDVDIHSPAGSTDSGLQNDESSFSFKWDRVMPVSVSASVFRLTESAFALHNRAADDATDPVEEGLQLTSMELWLDDLHASPDGLDLTLQKVTAQEAGGLRLNDMSGRIALTPDGTTLRDLYIESAGSQLALDLHTDMSVLDFALPLQSDYPIDLNTLEATLGRDLPDFLPAMSILFPDSGAPPVFLEAAAGGTVNDLNLETLSVTIPQRLRSEMAGNVQHLLSPRQIALNIPSLQLTGDAAEMLTYLPDTVRPAVTLPEHIDLEAAFQGRPDAFRMEAALLSDFANLSTSLYLNEAEGEGSSWELSLDVDNADILAFTGQKGELYDLSATFEAQGHNLSFPEMVMQMEGRLDSLRFNDYTYRDLDIMANLDHGLAALELEYVDEHLAFDLDGQASLAGDYPEMEVELDLGHLNARSLGFTEEMIALQTKLHAAVAFKEPDFPEGELHVDTTRLLLDREVFMMNGLAVETAKRNDNYFLNVDAPMLKAEYKGNFSPVLIPEALNRHIYSYIEPVDSITREGEMENQYFDMEAVVFSSPYLTEILFPQLSAFEPLSLSGGFDSRKRQLALEVDIPDLAYSGWQIQDMHAIAGSGPGQMDFSLEIPVLEGEPLSLKNIQLAGFFREQNLDFSFGFDDEEERAWLDVSGQLEQLADSIRVSVEESIVVNRQEWNVREGNHLTIIGNHILAHDLVISTDNKEIALYSSDPTDRQSALELHWSRINLTSFDLIGGRPLITGLFSGSIIANDLATEPLFDAEMEILEMGFRGDTIGDVTVQLENPATGLYNMNGSVRGYGNRLELAGSYRQDDPSPLDLEVHLEKLDLSTLEALAFDQLTDMSGAITGRLDISGQSVRPEVKGALHFNDVGFHLTSLGVGYTMPDESLVFDRYHVRFDQFSLIDPAGRRASVDGYIHLRELSDIQAGISVTSDNFLLMDLPQGVSDLYYGRLLIDTKLDMHGTLGEPTIEGNLSLNRGSSFTFLLPQYQPEAIGDEGVVQFIAIRDEAFEDILLRPEEPDPVMSAFDNLEISVNVEIDPETDVRVVIDELAGDYLQVKGGGLLNYGVKPGGQINLAGQYEITEGAYQMTFYDVIRRNFSILEGSRVSWMGDPLEADVDISASYRLRTSARELLVSHDGASDPTDEFRQLYPFDVVLHMEGDLMSPAIRFEITLPPEHSGAMDGRLQTRLNELNENESELNKQVFALLILGSFIQDDPLATFGSGPGISATARSSASRILSQQLNRLSDQYIRGVDLNFDVESYEQVADGQMVGRTQLQMEVSRDFLDQRLRITAGGHLELEDDTRKEVDPTDIAGDFSVEYLLFPDGRLTVKGYRERKYQNLYEGELVETGLSLIFRETYTTFRELFRSKEEAGDMIYEPDNLNGE